MEPNNTILDVLTNAGKFDTLLAAIDAAGIEDMFTSDEEYTLFAPNQEAFAKLEETLAAKGSSLTAILAEQDMLATILSYHVAPGKHTASDLSGMGDMGTLPSALAKAESEDAEMLKVTKSGDSLMINEAKVVTPDMEADNGVVHEIDSVLMPPNLQM